MKRKPSPTHEQAVLQLTRKRRILRTRDVAELGVPTVVLTRLVRSGKLERAGRGLFTLADHLPSAQRSLAEVSLRAPRGVVCLLSALRANEIGTQSPFEVWLALPPGVIPPPAAGRSAERASEAQEAMSPLDFLSAEWPAAHEAASRARQPQAARTGWHRRADCRPPLPDPQHPPDRRGVRPRARYAGGNDHRRSRRGYSRAPHIPAERHAY